MFSSELWEISKNTFSYRIPAVAASNLWWTFLRKQLMADSRSLYYKNLLHRYLQGPNNAFYLPWVDK